MAITVQQSVGSLRPAYNNADYILSSSNVSQPNFKYVVDYYIGGIKVDRQLIPPHPIHLTGLVNIAPILEQRVSSDIIRSDDRVLPNNNSYVQYVLKFGEAYGATTITIHPDLTTTSAAYMWNSIFDYPDFCNYSSTTYIASASAPCKFLTNKPSRSEIMKDDNAWLHWINLDLNTSFVRIQSIEKGEPDNIVDQWDVNNSYTTSRFLRFPTGINNVLSIPNGQFIIGSQPVDLSEDNGTDRYTIQVFQDGGAAISEKYYYKVVTNCSRYEKRRLQFLNKLGGYDFFNFTLVSHENMDIERSNYKKNLGSYANANSYVYSPNDRSISQFYTKIKDRVSLQSDWVTETQLIWLEELVTSPDVLLDNGTYLIPINITNTSFERKKVVNEKLFNLTIEYTLSYERYRQRR